MKLDEQQNAASTAGQDKPPKTVADTALPPEALRGPLRQPGPFMAAMVLAAMSVAGTPAILEPPMRRREEVVAESSTAGVEVDPALLKRVRQLFELGASEFFQDGMHSKFSRTLLRMMARYGRPMFKAIAEYLSSGLAKPDVAAEALQWLADFNDPSSFSERWAILQTSLKNRSPQVRDGAILAFAAIDDPRARSLLAETRDRERVRDIRRLIEKVIAQLERAR